MGHEDEFGGRRKQALAQLDVARETGDPFRLVLRDMHMPGMGGFGLIDEIRCKPEISAEISYKRSDMNVSNVSAQEEKTMRVSVLPSGLSVGTLEPLGYRSSLRSSRMRSMLS
jgi:CheY-like chemotaxis protein